VEQNPPLLVYDCSGPYTDPDADLDVARGLPALRVSLVEGVEKMIWVIHWVRTL